MLMLVLYEVSTATAFFYLTKSTEERSGCSMTEDEKLIVNLDALYNAYLKCRKGVSWKPSVMAFSNDALMNVYKLYCQLKDGTYKSGKPKTILITYPKRREGLSISFRDRIYQRAINDEVLYPRMTRSFIQTNCSCQKGKGTDYARKYLKEYLWAHYRNHGFDGYILQIDISKYYQSMSHEVVEDMFRAKLDDGAYKRVKEVLDNQYKDVKGYKPGSQMVQIAGISYLNPIDHYIKEKLHMKYYIRYMDDSIMIHPSKEYLEYALEQIKIELAKIGLKVNPKKTKIIPFSEKFTFLGFEYRVTDKGKVIMIVDRQSVKHEKMKLGKMCKRVKLNKMSVEKLQECFGAYKNHVSKGNSYNLTNKLNTYCLDLLKT